MRWFPVYYQVKPIKEKQYLVLTANKKVMVITNKELNDWLINKYSLTHWSPIALPE